MSSGSLTSWWQRKRRAHSRMSSPRTPLRWAPSCFVPASCSSCLMPGSSFSSHGSLNHGIGSQGPIPSSAPACLIDPNHMSPAGGTSCLLPFTSAAPVKCQKPAAFHICVGADGGGPGGAAAAGRAAGGVAGGGPRAVRQAGDSVQTWLRPAYGTACTCVRSRSSHPPAIHDVH